MWQIYQHFGRAQIQLSDERKWHKPTYSLPFNIRAFQTELNVIGRYLLINLAIYLINKKE